MEYVGNDIENQCSTLVTSMAEKLEKLPPTSSQTCIYRIPPKVRQINEKAYTPWLVSIGPFHHGKEGLEAMEEHKWRYLNRFLKWTEMSLKDAIEFIKERETRVRGFYAEIIRMGSHEFVEMILLDATFIMVTLLSHHFVDLRDENDRLFQENWLGTGITLDMVLLENQLPFFVLVDLLETARVTRACHPDDWPSMVSISLKNFGFLIGLDINAKVDWSSDIKHFIDLLRICYVPVKPNGMTIEDKGKYEFPRSLTELHEAGVKFKVSFGKGLLDIKFTNGVIEIPYILVSDTTETTFRNLLAFEQCHYWKQLCVTDFIALMDSLVKTPRDVELLTKNGIIENLLGNNSKVSTLFNNLAKELVLSPKRFHFDGLCQQLNQHCHVPWHKWNATLKHDHFENPWAVLSIIAAAILLILTFIQALCAVISLEEPSPKQ